MTQPYDTLTCGFLKDIGPMSDRPEAVVGPDLPQGFQLICADNHWEITEDIFFENFPAALKDQAPRVWYDDDGFWQVGRRGEFVLPEAAKAALSRNILHSAWSHPVRRKHLHLEGMGKEIAFPQSLLGFVSKDPTVREWTLRIYNDYIAEQSKLNDEFFGVGIFSNWWDANSVEAAMEQIVSLGLKTFMLPLTLRGPNGEELNFSDPLLDRFWAVANEAGLPVCLHIGEAQFFSGRGAAATLSLVTMAPFRRPLAQMIFGGVFDRYPNLKVVFAEGGLGWVLAFLQDAEMIFDTRGTILDPTDHRPSQYWHNNCYATFQTDRLGLSNLNVLGADRILWSADYPHSEGTFGVTKEAVNSIVDGVGMEDAKLILGDNARDLFRI